MLKLIYLQTLVLYFAFDAPTCSLAAEDYEQYENIVFAETHGVGLVLDVFVPKGEKNGLAIADVVSGAWSSSRGKIRDHQRAQLFKVFCRHGYTVFAIRPGSVSKFTGLEMVDHLHQGVRWVKAHAAEYDVDPDRFGMIGASAGGHLACLATVAADADIAPAAVAVFFPPTDLLAMAGGDLDLRSGSGMGNVLAAIGFNGHLDGVTEDQVRETLVQLSPARRVTGTEPPFLLIHGDADQVVPLAQSELMLKALQDKNVPAELIVKKNGGHPWLTIHEEVEVMASWMDKQLAPAEQ